MRIGLVGLDSTHADQFVHDLNVDQAFGLARVEALCGPDAERAQRLAAAGRVPLVVDDPAVLLGRVDAVIVGDRDGRLHLDHAAPFLRAGLPVLVDKPLATRLEDAVALVEMARRHGAPLTSFSAVRWARGLDRVRATAREWGGPRILLAIGPADVESPWGGISFYGVHMVEAALAVATGPIGAVSAFTGDGAVVATTTIGPTRVVFTFVRPTERGGVGYHLQCVGPERIAGGELTLDEHYLRPVLRAFLDMATTGEAPLSYDELLAPARILDGIDSALRSAEPCVAHIPR